jgi:hypothetical protein
MTERFDAPASIDDAAGGNESRKATERASGFTPLPLSARGFSAIMHREAGLRAPVRPPRQSSALDDSVLDEVSQFAALDLPQPLRRAVAALLRGDFVSAQERDALGRAVSLLSRQESVPAGSIWESFGTPANNNCAAADAPARAVVPPQSSPLGPDTENPVLRDLLTCLLPEPPQRDNS